MNITLDPSAIETAIQTHINKAVEQALAGYEVKKAISEKITSIVANGVIGQAIDIAVNQVDTATLTQRLAEEIQRNMTSAVSHFIRSGTVETILTMRGMNSYSAGYKEAKELLEAQLKAQS